MHLHNPFQITFYKVSIKNWIYKKSRLFDLVNWDDKDCWTDSHFSDFYRLGTDYRKPFVEILKEEFDHLGKNLNLPLVMKSLWAQRYLSSHFMQPHNHGPTGLSFVLYADFDSTHPLTTFYSPFHCPIRGDVIEYKPDVKEGDILFFPSMLLHFCEPNNSRFRRTIFSGNIMVN